MEQVLRSDGRPQGTTKAPQDAVLAYCIRNSIYLNITNLCTLACGFCPKFTDWMVHDYFLKLDRVSISAEVVLEASYLAARQGRASREDAERSLKDGGCTVDISTYDEVVFVGYGEPTREMALLLGSARLLRKAGAKRLRLDTDGLANLREGRDCIPELAAEFEAVSISLNAQNPEVYLRHCPNKYGEQAWHACKDFIRESTTHFGWVQASVVGMPDVDIEACQQIIERELGARFRYREYGKVG
jgi:GTP 3',8-cyclase